MNLNVTRNLFAAIYNFFFYGRNTSEDISASPDTFNSELGLKSIMRD
jgi:hypothetical protein